MTDVTCGLTAKKPGSAPCPTLIIEYGTTSVFFVSEHMSGESEFLYRRNFRESEIWKVLLKPCLEHRVDQENLSKLAFSSQRDDYVIRTVGENCSIYHVLLPESTI